MEQNYLPLFRKYRPQSFKDIVGQESLVKALTNAIELNRIANAYLFCGPRGTGKTSSARIFAKSLNCINGPTINPCQKCASCVDITNAAGLDVIEIDAASNRGIQDAKDLISQVQYAPINGKYKIFIIDEVHMLTNEAFNALLKTFEEPPKNVIFILATTEPHKVLETIVSRCQRFDLRRITTDDIVKKLREISDIENIKITNDALFTIAKNVSGGLRDSLALLDQVSILGVKEEIDKSLIEEVLGKINFDILIELLERIDNEDIVQSIELVNKIYDKGNEPRSLAENFIEFLRNIVLVLNSQNPNEVISFTSFIKDDIEKIQTKNFDKEKMIKILDKMIKFYPEIKNSTNPYLWMELGVINCCKINSLKEDEKIYSNKNNSINKIALNIQAPIQTQQTKPLIKEIKQTITQESAPKTEVIEEQTKEIPTQEENKTTIIPADIAQNQDSAEIWLNILDKITSPIAKAMYKGTVKLIGIKDEIITLGYANEGAYKQVQTKYTLLEEAIKITYPNLSVTFKKIDSSTKFIELKQITNSYQPPQQNNFQKFQQSNYQNNVKQNNNNVSSNSMPFKNGEEDEEAKNEKKHYSPQVQDMLEQFNGRIIE